MLPTINKFATDIFGIPPIKPSSSLFIVMGSAKHTRLLELDEFVRQKSSLLSKSKAIYTAYGMFPTNVVVASIVLIR